MQKEQIKWDNKKSKANCTTKSQYSVLQVKESDEIKARRYFALKLWQWKGVTNKSVALSNLKSLWLFVKI